MYVLVVSLLMLTLTSALSNLDIKEPIVRRSPALDDDSFGFAVLLHQVEVPVARDIASFLDRTRYVVARFAVINTRGGRDLCLNLQDSGLT